MRERNGAPAERVDRLVLGRRVLRRFEPGERLKLIPRRVARERVRRDVELDVDRVRKRLLLRKGERDAPLHTARIVDSDPDLRIQSLFIAAGADDVQTELLRDA